MFDLRRHLDKIELHKNANIKEKQNVIQLSGQEGSSGFRILLPTIKGQFYVIKIRGRILDGSHLFIYCESHDNEQRLISREYQIGYLDKEMELVFQAQFSLTNFGLLFMESNENNHAEIRLCQVLKYTFFKKKYAKNFNEITFFKKKYAKNFNEILDENLKNQENNKKENLENENLENSQSENQNVKKNSENENQNEYLEDSKIEIVKPELDTIEYIEEEAEAEAEFDEDSISFDMDLVLPNDYIDDTFENLSSEQEIGQQLLKNFDISNMLKRLQKNNK